MAVKVRHVNEHKAGIALGTICGLYCFVNILVAALTANAAFVAVANQLNIWYYGLAPTTPLGSVSAGVIGFIATYVFVVVIIWLYRWIK